MVTMVDRAEATIKDEPGILERIEWQRLRRVVSEEVTHPDWGSSLYALHRSGRLDNDQREAGDRYARLVRDYRKLWVDPAGLVEVYRAPEYEHLDTRSPLTADVERMMGHVEAYMRQEESEFEIKRAQRISKKYKEARGVAGVAVNKVEDLLIYDIWPVGGQGHREIAHALTRLYYFFATGTKRERK
jgi:hypothetical protein